MEAFSFDIQPRADISAAEDLYADFLKAEESNLPCNVNCANVEVFSAGVAQLMVSAKKTFESCGRVIHFQNPSDTMKRDLEMLGLLTLIEG